MAIDPLEHAVRRFDRIVDYIADHRDLIVRANVDLGIDLDVSIGSAARVALTKTAVDSDRQLLLSIVKSEGGDS